MERRDSERAIRDAYRKFSKKGEPTPLEKVQSVTHPVGEEVGMELLEQLIKSSGPKTAKALAHGLGGLGLAWDVFGDHKGRMVMKKLTRELLVTYGIGLLASCIAGAVTYWVSRLWELATVVGIVVLACFARDSISTYFGLRRNPEYQKDTKDP